MNDRSLRKCYVLLAISSKLHISMGWALPNMAVIPPWKCTVLMAVVSMWLVIHTVCTLFSRTDVTGVGHHRVVCAAVQLSPTSDINRILRRATIAGDRRTTPRSDRRRPRRTILSASYSGTMNGLAKSKPEPPLFHLSLAPLKTCINMSLWSHGHNTLHSLVGRRDLTLRVQIGWTLENRTTWRRWPTLWYAGVQTNTTMSASRFWSRAGVWTRL
jgi:hypothetical protein